MDFEGEEVSMWHDKKRGVRQGCVQSPDHFIIYSKTIMRDLMELVGIKVAGKKFYNVWYADGTMLFADSSEIIAEFGWNIGTGSKKYGLKLNRAKTKVMVMTKGNDNVRVKVRAGEKIFTWAKREVILFSMSIMIFWQNLQIIMILSLLNKFYQLLLQDKLPPDVLVYKQLCMFLSAVRFHQ